jgi:hypothetical protein
VYPSVDCFPTINRPKKGKDTLTMSNDNVIELKKPDAFVDDPITDILHQGARKLLAWALETEIDIFISQYRPAGKTGSTSPDPTPFRSFNYGPTAHSNKP